MATYKKELPTAYEERAVGNNRTAICKHISPSHYTTETEMDTITIPLLMYENLINEHQPERYQRAMEKVDIIRRLAEARRSDGCAMIEIDVILMICGLSEKDTLMMKVDAPTASEVMG